MPPSLRLCVRLCEAQPAGDAQRRQRRWVRALQLFCPAPAAGGAAKRRLLPGGIAGILGALDPAALKRFCQFLLVFLSCLQLCGGPPGLAQCIAWAGMLVNYARQDGLVLAVEKTFDGEHPCSLCKSIAKAQEQQDPEPVKAPAADPWKGCRDAAVAVPAELPSPGESPLVVARPGDPVARCGRLASPPPVPPPRGVA
jgi:hypothetical protein